MWLQSIKLFSLIVKLINLHLNGTPLIILILLITYFHQPLIITKLSPTVKLNFFADKTKFGSRSIRNANFWILI